MGVLRAAAAALCLTATLAAHSASTPPADATAILAAAREALGGEKNLAAVKSFVATGRTRQVRGNNLVPIEFQVFCELPDKYVRKDEVPAQESEPTTSGFNGDLLIQVPPPPEMPAQGLRPAGSPGGAPGARPAGTPTAGPAPDPRAARVATLKQDFVKLTLGMFAASFSSYPVSFSHVGQAEAPQGKADIIEAKGPGNFTVKLFIHDHTHLPIMVSWMVPATNAVVVAAGQPAPENLPPGSVIVEAPTPPAATAPKDELDRYAKEVQDLRRKALTGRMVEHRLYYADYRDAGNGLRFPFRLRRAVAGETIEETNFDGFTVNRRIDPKRFETVKQTGPVSKPA